MGDSDRFEELDDLLSDYGDLDKQLQEIAVPNGNIHEPEEDNSLNFSILYAPVRAVFSSDTTTLNKFSELGSARERIDFLLQLEAVKAMLSKLHVVRPNILDNQITEFLDQLETGELKNAPNTNEDDILSGCRPSVDVPELPHGRNNKYPQLSKSVEVKFSPGEGRHLVAKQRINPGEIIIVDTAHTTSLFSDQYPTHCYTCFSRIQNSKVSCPWCDKVKFCSLECVRNGLPKIHRWECSVLEVMDNTDIGRMATLAYRILTITGVDYIKENLDQMDKLTPSYSPGDYPSVYCQIDNMNARPAGDHLKRGVTAIILARCLELAGWMSSSQEQNGATCNQEELFSKMAALILHHIQANSCNAYEINELVKKGDSMVDCQSIELGGAVYPTISLSNHSCAANTSRTNFGTWGCMKAIKTIFPNEKIFDNYGHFYHIEEKENRQQLLAAQYFFNCNCLACKDNWPLYRDLGQQPTTFCCPACKAVLGSSVEKMKKCGKCKKELKGLAKLSSQIRNLQQDFRNVMDSISRENAKDQVKIYAQLLADMEKVMRLPCKEIIVCQQVVMNCFAMLGNSTRIALEPADCQVALYNGPQDESEDDDEDDDDDIPGLI